MKLFSTNKGSYLRSVVTGVLVGAVLAITFVSGFYFRELLDLPAPIAVSAGAPDADGYPLVDEVQTLLLLWQTLTLLPLFPHRTSTTLICMAVEVWQPFKSLTVTI